MASMTQEANPDRGGMELSLEHVFASTEISALLLDTQGRVRRANPASLRLSGYAEQELVGRHLGEFLTPASKALAEQLPKLPEKGALYQEVEFLRRDGAALNLGYVALPLRNERGEITSLVLLLCDLTERRRAEGEIGKSKQVLENITQGITDSVILVSHDFRILWANRAALGKYGEKILGSHCYKATHSRESPCDSRLEPCPLRGLGKTDGPTSVVHTHLDKAGKETFVEVTAYPIRDANGEIVEYVHVSKDITERKEAEEALKESEERYRVLVEGAGRLGMGILMLQDTPDREAAIVFANQALAELLGYSQEELCGMSLASILPSRHVDTGLEHYRRRRRGEGGPVTIEMTLAAKEGHSIRVEVTGGLITYQGRVTNLLHVRDIRARKQMERRLRLLSMAVEQAGEGVAITGMDGKLLFVNPAYARMHGYEVEELVGRYFGLLMAKGQRQTIASAIELSQQKGPWSGELRRKRKDGSTFYSLTSWNFFRDEGGQPRGWVTLVNDITETKQAQEELQRRNRELSALVKAAQAISSTLDLDSVLKAVVRAALQMIPAAQDATLLLYNNATGMLELRASAGIPDEASAAHLVCTPIAVRGKTLGVINIYSHGGDGGPHFSPADLELLQAFANAAALAVENARLHNELKQSAAELDRKVKERTQELEMAHAHLVSSERLAAIGQLAAMVSHELRNPLAVMNNSVYYLKMKLRDLLNPSKDEAPSSPNGDLLGLSKEDTESKLGRHLEILEKEIAISNSIISQLLEFARPRPPVLRECDLSSVVAEALERATGLDKLEVVKELASGLPPVKADPDQMQQVFLNIIKNAAEAMPQGGRLAITTARRNSYLEVSFQDTGPGIPPENLKRIFEPLFTTKARGTGLGLAISKSIIEAHHGSIEVRSQPGKGAIFAVRLPLG